MSKIIKKHNSNSQQGIYQVGLNRKCEAVISEHFMHDINQHSNFKIYNHHEFLKSALTVDSKWFTEHLIPLLIDNSNKFIEKRVIAAKNRALNNFKQYGLDSPDKISMSEIITEVMFDRQFMKGPKLNVSRIVTSQYIKKLVKNDQPIKMIILALPYKSSSPLKCRGPLPDLADINYLLELSEVAKTIDCIYREFNKNTNITMSRFIVISDGRRFNTFLNETDKTIISYQENLHWWIKKIGIENWVEILDYQNIISNVLPKNMQLEKIAIRNHVKELYTNLMNPLLDTYNMTQTMIHAVEIDPDPESSNPEGRFIPLFKSLIYIINYDLLSNYVKSTGENYVDLYTELTKHIFKPYLELTANDLAQIEAFISVPKSASPPRMQLLEYLRQSMLHEAWSATINYIAEIRSDRDLPQEPILTCFPDHIRWTIHAKPGQLAMLNTTAFGDPVQSWHGIGTFKKTKYNRIKLYTLPVISLEGTNAIPVTVENIKSEPLCTNQPLFYVNTDIAFKNVDDLFEQLKKNLTRNRKR